MNKKTRFKIQENYIYKQGSICLDKQTNPVYGNEKNQSIIFVGMYT